MNEASPDTVFLVPVQNPQAEIQLLVQVLGALGLQPQQSSDQNAIILKGAQETVTIKPYMEVGVFRMIIEGERAEQIGGALGQYLPVLSAESLMQQYTAANAPSEKRLLGVLLFLAHSDATSAMEALGNQLMQGDEEDKVIVVQGLTMLETPDCGPLLEQYASEESGQVANFAQRGYDSLVERGVVKESATTLMRKALALLEEDAEAALELLDKAADLEHAADALLWHRVQVLRALERFDEAMAALAQIPTGEYTARCTLERALLLERSGEPRRALADAKRAVALDPGLESAQAAVERLALQDNGEESPEQQLEAVKGQLEQHPEDINLIAQRGELLLELGRFEEARRDLSKAARALKEDHRLQVFLAEAALGAGRYCEALRPAGNGRTRRGCR